MRNFALIIIVAPAALLSGCTNGVMEVGVINKKGRKRDAYGLFVRY